MGFAESATVEFEGTYSFAVTTRNTHDCDGTGVEGIDPWAFGKARHEPG